MNVSKPARLSAFSLVEMLVVIAIIGILAAIAVPSISRVNEASNDAKDRRNAQNLASVFNSAQAAGVDFSDSRSDGNTDVIYTIENIVDGGKVTSGTLNGAYFGIPGLSTREIEEAGKYLFYDVPNKQLRYSQIAY